MYDVVTSSLCLESACATFGDYMSAIRNISNLLKDGGYIVISGVLEETFYRVGNFRFPCLTLSSEKIRSMWGESGFTVMEWRKLFKETPIIIEENDFSDFKDAFCMLARKGN